MSDHDEFDDADVPTRLGDRKLLQQTRATPGKRERAYVVVIAGRSVGSMFAVQPGLVIGRGEDAGIRIVDDEISRSHCRLVEENGQILVVDLRSTNGTFVNGQAVERRALRDGDKIQVGTTTILKFSYHDAIDESFQRQMYESALRDALTGAYNRKYLHDALTAELSYASRHRAPVSLIMFDVDFFKKVNDTYGHLGGDQVLIEISRFVQGMVRKEDLFARYGGEEFAVLARGVGAGGAVAFAERLRSGVEKLRIVQGGSTIAVTVSLGVASAPSAGVGTPEDLVSRADDALYRAKRTGRNRVELYEDS